MAAPLIDDRSVQLALKATGVLSGAIDGIYGPQSMAAAKLWVKRRVPGYRVDWPASRIRTAAEQLIMLDAGLPVGAVDGLIGPQTKYALERWQDRSRDIAPPRKEIGHLSAVWPRQAEMAKFYGEPGNNHVLMDLPYPMRLAWSKAQIVKRITINSKCAESATRALAKALDHYGIERIGELGLDLFGGCYANRAMRGGKSLSTHAFACAIDINPEANQLRWGSDRADMAQPECAAFLDAFASEGWVSLGRERNFDWMHLQAARL